MAPTQVSRGSILRILWTSFIAQSALPLVAWTAVLLFCAILSAYASLLLYTVLRRARRGLHLDRVLLRIHLLRRRRSPAAYRERLERQIVWGVLAASVLDVSRRF